MARLFKKDSREALGPSWKHRRRLIYLGYFLGAFMIIFGAATYAQNSEVSVQLVIGGVALISIILTSYTAFATLEDVKLWKHESDEME